MLWTVAATVVYIVSYVIEHKGFPYHKLAHDFDGAARRACMTSFIALVRIRNLRNRLFVTEIEDLLQSLTDTECGLKDGDWTSAMDLLRERAQTLSDGADCLCENDGLQDAEVDTITNR
ncbi:hypothetical protein CYMTET_26118 [Cymbomonas tetramitiformis]|nr:hypothetical protein CYMTET_26118 [Cymbomonas tetramitiformis]